jgi:hypothetical protein
MSPQNIRSKRTLLPFVSLVFFCLALIPPPASAAEWEMPGNFAVNGAAIFKSSAVIIAPETQSASLWVSTSAITPHLFVSTTGRVGIGTASPAAELYMVGISSFTGNVYMQNGSHIYMSTPAYIHLGGGAANQVLANDGGNALKWTTLSSLGGDNLGIHIATTTLNMADFGIVNVASITVNHGITVSSITVSGEVSAFRYQINGSTVLAVLPGTESMGIGVNAGRVNPGNYNVFIGSAAGKSLTAGTSATFVGNKAGSDNAGSNRGTWVGASAGGNSGCENCTFIGASAGIKVNGAGSQVIVGEEAALDMTSGSYNTIMGYMAGKSNATGQRNVLLGNAAGSGSGSYSNSSVIGYQAGFKLGGTSPQGDDNLLLGYQAGYSITTGTGNIVLGSRQDTSAVNRNNELNIGGTLFGDLKARTIGISMRAPQAALDVVSTGTATAQMAQIWRSSNGVVQASMSATGVMMANFFFGDGSGLTGGDNLGSHIATMTLNMANFGIVNAASVTVTNGITASSLTISGETSANSYQINGSTVLAILSGVESMGVGINAGIVSTGSYNVYLGSAAGKGNTYTDNNTILGVGAGIASASVARDRTFVGASAGASENNAYSHTFVGALAGYRSTTGSKNTVVGKEAAAYMTVGVNNTVMGFMAAKSNSWGNNNVVLGNAAGSGTGSYSASVVIGYQAGFSLGNNANWHLLLGYQAGYSITTGTGNIVLGSNQDTSAATRNNELNIGGTLFGDLNTKTIGISTRAPQAALDVVSTGTATAQMAQIWRSSNGVVQASMSATGVMMAAKFIGDGSGLTGISGDDLGSHIATTTLNMGNFGVINVASMTVTNGITASSITASGEVTASHYRINGSTVLAIPGTESISIGLNAGGGNTGSYNVFVGADSGRFHTSGSQNTFAGRWTAGRATSGAISNNTFVGMQAGDYAGSSMNTCVGTYACSVPRPYITAIGGGAGWAGTPSSSTLLGFFAGYVRDGSANVLIGLYAGAGGPTNQSYSNATVIGDQAGFNLLTNANDNLLLGYRAGYSITAGIGNIVLGSHQDTSANTANNQLNIGGTLFGDLNARTIGISMRAPQAALDVVSTGAAAAQMAQIWRNSNGVVQASMSATGVMMATKFIGDGSGLTGGDNLGSHIAATTLNMGAQSIINAASGTFTGSVSASSMVVTGGGGVLTSIVGTDSGPGYTTTGVLALSDTNTSATDPTNIRKFPLAVYYSKSGSSNQSTLMSGAIFSDTTVSNGAITVPLIGVWSRLEGKGGTVNNAYSFYADSDTAGGGGTIVNRSGLKVLDIGRTATGNQYGIYIANLTNGVNDYGIYSAGGKNYFAGNVGIGVTAPVGLLQVGGGSLTVLSSGYVGIGMTNPTAQLEVTAPGAANFKVVPGVAYTSFWQAGVEMGRMKP